jgi:hypothetical protein
MHSHTFVLVFAASLLCATHLNAQQKGCPIALADRTIAICTPPDGSSISNGHFIFAHVNDSLPYTLCWYIDGVKQDCNLQFTPDGGYIVLPSPGWHRYTFVAFDSAGVFKSATYFKITSEPQCKKPATDRQINICSPISGAQVLSPTHISAVANSTSIAAKFTVAYIDDVEVARSYAQSNLPADTISAFFPLAVGEHTLKIKVVDQDNHTFSKSTAFSVVAIDIN